MSAMSYRDRLRRARIDAGLSQLELALRTGISTSTISAVEQGARDLTAPKLFLWVRACQASLEWVAGDELEQQQPDPTLVPLDLEPVNA